VPGEEAVDLEKAIGPVPAHSWRQAI